MADTIEALEAHLEHEPDDLDAYVRLKRLLQGAEDHERVASLVEFRASRTADDGNAAKLFHEAARIVSYYLRDDERTVGLLARSLDRDPRHEEAIDDLDRMLEVTGDARRHAAVLERRARRLSELGANPAEASLVHHRIGEIYEQDLGRSDKALAHYRIAYELDPENVAAIYAAREIHRLSGNLTAAATLLEMEAAAEPDRDRRKALLHELAHLASEALRDEDRAVKALAEAVTEDPRDVETLHAYALALHRRASGRPGSEASTRDLAEMADVLVRIGDFVDEPTAVSFLESALDATPTHEAALEGLERLCERLSMTDRLPVRWVAYLSAGGHGPKSAKRRHLLADAYIAGGRPEDAIVCLEPLLESDDADAAQRLVDLYRQVGRTEGLPKAMRVSASQSDIPMSDAAKIESLRELLRVAREARDSQETRRIAEELIALEPNDQPAFDVLVLTLASKADHASLLALHRRLGMDERVRIERRLEAWRAAASVAKERLHDDDTAIDAWRAIAALAPDDLLAKRGLRERLRAADRHGELAEELARAAESGDEDRPALLRDLLDLAVQPEVGASLIDRAVLHGVSAGVRDAAVFERGIDAAERAGRYEDAVNWLEERAGGVASDAERAAMLLRASRIAANKLEDAPRALSLLERRAALVPLDLALADEAIRHARAADVRARVLELLEARMALVDAGQIAAARTAAARYADEEANQHDDALRLYHDVLEHTPDDAEAEDAIRGILSRVERHADLVAFLERRAARDPSRAGALLHEAVRVADTAGLDVPIRVRALEAQLSHAHDPEALGALLTLLREHGPHATLVRHLASAITHAGSEDEKTAYAMERVTVLADTMGDDAAALEALEAIRVMAPSFVPAVGKMATIHERRGDHAALTHTLRTQLGIARGPSQRLETARRILAIHDELRPDADAALEALRAWRLAAPDDASPVTRMVPLLEAKGAHAEALEALDALLALAPDDPERDERRRRAAAISEAHLGDVDGALERLLAGALDGDPLAEPELRRVAAKHEKTRELARALEALGRAVDAPAEAHRRLLEAADVYENALDDHAHALECTIAAYELGMAAAHLLAPITELAERASAYDRLYTFHLRRADDTEGDASGLDPVLEALAIAAAHLPAPQAKRALTRALEVAGDDVVAIGRVERAAAEHDVKHPGKNLVRTIVAEIDARAHQADETTRRALAIRAARLLLHLAGRAREAFDRLLEATENDTDDTLHTLLVESAVAAGAGARLHEMLEQRVDEAMDAIVARTAMRARASLFERESQHSEAADLYQRLSGMSPNDDALKDAHRQALARAGRHQDLLSALDGALRRAKSEDEKVAIARERAKLWEGPLANRYEAIDAWKKLITLRPSDDEANAAIRRLSPKTRVGADELEDAPEFENLPPRPSRAPGARPSVPPRASAPARESSPPARQSVPPPVPSTSARAPSVPPARESAPPAQTPASAPPSETRELSSVEQILAAPIPPPARLPEPISIAEPISEAVRFAAAEPVSAMESIADADPSAESPIPQDASASEAESARAHDHDTGSTTPITARAGALDVSLLDEPIEDDFDQPVPRRAERVALSDDMMSALDQELTDDDDDFVEDASDFVEDASDFVEELDHELLDDETLEADEAPPVSVARISPPPPPPRKS